jgi:transcriptional regulator with XRE-family HTH domain
LTLDLEDSIKRSEEMYQLRQQEKLTLQEIGNRFGLSRERVRQIFAKYERVYLRRKQLAQGELRIVVMGDLDGLVPSRVNQIIRIAALQSYPVQSFIDLIDLRDILNYPNVGVQTIYSLLTIFEKAGYDVSHLWTARDWQNYDPPKHNGKGIGHRNLPNLYRIPSLHPQSGEGGEGEGLPEI